ncbi:MAG: uroporphyrinogen decarboxylase [Calditrichia bacterium]
MNNPLIVQAAKRQQVTRTPAWMMRQAGRYLPEYRKVREQADFLTMVRTPELAAEVTLQPLRRFKIDAAIIFSDILVIPEAMGMELKFIESKGPQFTNPIRSAEQISSLITDKDHILDDLNYVAEALKLVRNELPAEKGLIGFSGAPWTLASYMIEGQGSKNFLETKKFAFHQPEAFAQLLNMLSETIIHYVNMQIEAGAQLIQLFDSWAGYLNPEDFRKYCAEPVSHIIKSIKDSYDVPVIYFPKGANGSLPIAASTGADILSVDWTISMTDAKSLIADTCGLQGNMDPLYLYSNPKIIYQEVDRILKEIGPNFKGHIFNLGHGVLPTTPVENVEAFFDAIYELSPNYHK